MIRWDEAGFAPKLVGFDWTAILCCRIVNPISPSEKFDAESVVVRRQAPELVRLTDAALPAPCMARPIELGRLRLGVAWSCQPVHRAETRTKTLAKMDDWPVLP